MIEELRLFGGLEQYSKSAIAIATVIKWRFYMKPLKQFAARIRVITKIHQLRAFRNDREGELSAYIERDDRTL